MPSPSEITVAQLNRLIGTPECPVIVDISIDQDFAEDPFLIPGAIRHPHTDIAGLKLRLNGRACVVVCQKGIKLSQGLVAWLQNDGLKAEYLQGGNYGWRDAPDTMRVPAASLPDPIDGASLWVTRHRPKIDRIACPWLIRRFIDRDARFLFVSPKEVEGVASRYGATPFDVEGATFGHYGDKCTFDALLDTFQLHSTALDRMAQVIRAADTGHHAKSPQAAGLLAISVGLSRQFKNDQQQLDAGMGLYDALYRWARDGFDEEHKG